jgi:hypothetical protein
MTEAGRFRTRSTSPTHDATRSNGCKRILRLLDTLSVISFLRSLTSALFQYRLLTRKHIGALPVLVSVASWTSVVSAIFAASSLGLPLRTHVHDQVIKRRRRRRRRRRDCGSCHSVPRTRRPDGRSTERLEGRRRQVPVGLPAIASMND